MQIPAQWRYPPDSPFYKILVPTVDTIRNSYIIQALVKANKHVLLVGNTGTGTSPPSPLPLPVPSLRSLSLLTLPWTDYTSGKTSTVQGILTNPPDGFSALTINFSAQTSYVFAVFPVEFFILMLCNSSNRVQEIIESNVEKRTKDVYVPQNGKKMIVFVDDLNILFPFVPLFLSLLLLCSHLIISLSD